MRRIAIAAVMLTAGISQAQLPTNAIAPAPTPVARSAAPAPAGGGARGSLRIEPASYSGAVDVCWRSVVNAINFFVGAGGPGATGRAKTP